MTQELKGSYFFSLIFFFQCYFNEKQWKQDKNRNQIKINLYAQYLKYFSETCYTLLILLSKFQDEQKLEESPRNASDLV